MNGMVSGGNVVDSSVHHKIIIANTVNRESRVVGASSVRRNGWSGLELGWE